MATEPSHNSGEVLSLERVSFIRDGKKILDSVDFEVRAGQRWAVLGPNGCGKSTLLAICSMALHPSSGTVALLGETLGETDVRELRKRAGYASSALADSLRPAITALDAVISAKNTALETWWHKYEPSDYERGAELLAQQGLTAFGDRPFGTLSSGERQRVLLARALMTDPDVVLLDEPAAAMDLKGRESLIRALDTMAESSQDLAILLVTHHVEEIPRSFTHILMINSGSVVAAGPIGTVLTEKNLSDTFDVALSLHTIKDRHFAICEETGSDYF